MIEGLIARFKAFVMTAAAVIAVLFGAYMGEPQNSEKIVR